MVSVKKHLQTADSAVFYWHTKTRLRRLHVTTTHYKLDRIDHKIIEILKTDGRISYQRLAELIHLTPRPCQERVRKLERAGIIRGYTALIEEETEHATGIVLQLHIALASQNGR